MLFFLGYMLYVTLVFAGLVGVITGYILHPAFKLKGRIVVFALCVVGIMVYSTFFQDPHAEESSLDAPALLTCFIQSCLAALALLGLFVLMVALDSFLKRIFARLFGRKKDDSHQ
jgi:hypothetical protein